MQAPADGLEGLVAHSVRELESLSREQDQNKCTDPVFEFERATKAPRTTNEPTRAGLRHVQTEQRRRDRINEGFAALKALMPGHEKADKATFLSNTVAYIKQLQGVMQQLVSTGAVSKLPEEAQWNIRVLLPRNSDAPVATFTVPAVRAAAPILPAPVPDPAAATATMLSLLLNQPNGMAGQQGQPGLDIAQLLQQAAFSQQLQAQQGQLLQTLQMQQLFQAAQQSTGMLVQNTPAPGAAAFSNMGQFLSSEPMSQAHLMPPMTVGCTQGTPANALPKARKNGKVRRHTSAARIAKPATEADAPAVDVGRPAPTEVGL
ncbi:probable anthocyanin regulatory Lc protein at N-terminal half [Coccomyxa sp. Obi]|nr:probable anthocyanin regulatory Lc protein at N-terminal half [Coccomyxa sp. Obi]